MMDADGNTSSTIVSEWLKNPEGAENVSDTTILSDITAVKGTAEYTETGANTVNWTTDGGDIYYQGQTNADLPVSVQISYELDGKKVTAEELDGATGHLKMTFDYENNTATERVIHGETRTIYQPFMVISAMMLDNDKATNVEVSDGKTINSGDVTIVFGTAMPGLADSLGLNEIEDDDGEPVDIDIPEQVVVEADVTDFSLLMTLTVASNNALEELGLDDFDSLDDLKEQVGDLTDGMDEIIDGATKLDDGVTELSDKSKDLSDGANDLNDGAVELSDGAYKVADGANKVNGGASSLQNGVKKVNSGAKQVNDGAADLKTGIDTLEASAPALKTGVEQLDAGAGGLADGIAKITGNNNENNKKLNDGAAQLAGDLSLLNSSLSGVDTQTLASGSASVQKGLDGVSAGLEGILEGYNPTYDSDAEANTTAATMIAALQKEIEDGNVDPTVVGEINGLIVAYKSMYTDVSTISTSVNNLNTSYASVDGGINLLNDKMQTLSGSVSQLSEGATKLQTGIQGYTDGVSDLQGGITQVKDGLDNLNGQLPTLVNGIDQLSTGAATLSAGTTTLAKGTGDLEKGAKTLAEGADDLAEGAGDLADGANKLSDGTSDMKDGVAKLIDGVAELLDGTGDLKEGVIKFDDEGISKIADLVNDDLDKYYDRLCAARDYAREYTSYAGCNEGVECDVKFIYKTDGIGE
jgi:putative membrane protein